MLRGAAVLRVVMNSNQRGDHGKSWVLSCGKAELVFLKLTEIFWKMEQTPVYLPRCEARRYTVKTIAVNLKLWLHFKKQL